MKKKLLTALLSAAMAVTLLAGCGSASKEEAAAPAETETEAEAPAEEETAEVKALEDMYIATVSNTFNDNFFLNYQIPFEALCEASGMEYLWTAPAGSELSEQLNLFENTLATNPDAIYFAPKGSDGCEAVLDAAEEQGVIVGLFDADVNAGHRDFFMGTSPYELGVVCAEQMIEALPDGGNVVCVMGVADAEHIVKRKDGFVDTLEGTNINVVDVLAYDPTNITSATVDAIEQYLGAYGDETDGMMVCAAWPLYADRDSMPTLLDWTANGGVLINIDTSYEAIEFIEDGTCYAHVAQATNEAANNAFEILTRRVQGEDLYDICEDMGLEIEKDTNTIWLDAVLVNKDNCDEIKKTLPEGF